MTLELASLRGLDAHKAARAQYAARLLEIEQESGGALLNEAQKAEFDEIGNPTDGILAQLDAAIEELEVRDARVKAAIAAQDQRSIEVPFSAPTVIRKLDNETVFDLAGYRARVGSIDELPRAYRDGAMRVLEMSDFPTSKDPAKAKAHIERLMAAHLDDVSEGRAQGWIARRVIGTGSPVYRDAAAQYIAKGREGMSPRLLAELQTGSDADGGFAIPFTIDPTFVITTDGAASALREFSNVQTITTKSWHPLVTEDNDASYGTEIAATTDSAPNDIDDLNGVTPLRAKRFIKFTAEYQEDYGPAAILAQVGKLIADSKSRLEADKFVQGTGSGEPEGIIWKIDDDGSSLVSQANFDLDALDALTAALGPRFRVTADGDTAYMANISILQKLRQLGTAGAPANSIYDAISQRLNGYAARELSAMDDVWTSGKEVLLFGDFGYFVIVDRIGLSVEYVPQVFDGSGDPLGQRGIYARWRNTSKVMTVNAFRLLTHS